MRLIDREDMDAGVPPLDFPKQLTHSILVTKTVRDGPRYILLE